MIIFQRLTMLDMVLCIHPKPVAPGFRSLFFSIGSHVTCFGWYVLEYDYLPMTDHANKHDLVYPPNLYFYWLVEWLTIYFSE